MISLTASLKLKWFCFWRPREAINLHVFRLNTFYKQNTAVNTTSKTGVAVKKFVYCNTPPKSHKLIAFVSLVYISKIVRAWVIARLLTDEPVSQYCNVVIYVSFYFLLLYRASIWLYSQFVYNIYVFHAVFLIFFYLFA